MPDGEQTLGEEVVASAIEGAVAKFSEPAVKSDPFKEKIPANNLFDILRNEQYMKALQPLIANVVLKAASIDSLREKINKLFETENNEELTQALTTLQKKLRSIYTTGYTTTTGGKRRRTKKRKHYKKRRSTKHR